jgi:threonine dehydratase
MVHPFDDADVIAGQGTIGMEILKVYIENFIICMHCQFRPLALYVSVPLCLLLKLDIP